MIWISRATAADTETATSRIGLVDVDTMAARMQTNQDLYKKIRDEAFAAYAKRNPTPGSGDDEIKTVIRILAYLWVWDDFYGEGLWQRGVHIASDAGGRGESEPLMRTFKNLKWMTVYYCDTEDSADWMIHDTDLLLAGDYPAEFKVWACQAMLGNLADYGPTHHVDPQAKSMQAIPHFLEQWGRYYRELIKQGLPHQKLFDLGQVLQYSVRGNESVLFQVIGEQDRAFNEVDPKNPVRMNLDGEFYAKDAANVNDSEVDNSTPPNPAEVYQQRLAKAAEILDPLYDQFPNESETCCPMMAIVTSQGKGKDDLEKWFQRAIKIDPNYFEAYYWKARYLLPDNRGSLKDTLAFGQECVDTHNWAAKIPMIFPTAIAFASDGNPELYTRPEIWTKLEKVYRDYLDRYPSSIFYRTNFAKHAADGGHLDVAREQIKILGSDWDHDVLSESEYSDLITKLNSP